MAARAPKGNYSGSYVTQAAFEREKEQLEGQKRGQQLRGLRADVQTEGLKADAKEVQTTIAGEALSQTKLKLDAAKVRTGIEREHLAGIKAEAGYIKTEYQLKGQVWQLKLDGYRADIETAKQMLQAKRTGQGLPSGIPTSLPTGQPIMDADFH